MSFQKKKKSISVDMALDTSLTVGSAKLENKEKGDRCTYTDM